MSSFTGLTALIKLVRSNDLHALAKCKLSSELFLEPELPVWDFMQDHLAQYGVLPSEETLLSKGVQDLPTPEPLQYYVDQLIERYTHKKLGKMVQEVKDQLNQSHLDEAQNLIKGTVTALTSLELSNKLMELSADAKSEYFSLYQQKNNGLLNPLLMGWPYLDKLTGGLIRGDVVSIIGRPGQGKSWTMLYSAMDMWAAQERDILFVSMEMPSEAILARVLGMYAKVNAGNVKNAELSESEKGMVSQGLRQISLEKAKFWVLDANLSGTVSDVFNMVAHLQPDAVFIDGAYLLRNENPRLGRYERVAENVEVIKRMAHTSGVPCLTSWQFNREASKKKKKDEKPGLEDIGYSDAIGQISSVVLGLMEEEIADIQQLKSRVIHILKGRNGEVGEFKINWLFHTTQMDFSELEEDDTEVLLEI